MAGWLAGLVLLVCFNGVGGLRAFVGHIQVEWNKILIKKAAVKLLDWGRVFFFNYPLDIYLTVIDNR